MTRPKRIRLSRARGWTLPANAVDVSKGPWANPFIVGRDGTAAYCAQLYESLMTGLICLTASPSIGYQRRTLRYAVRHIGALRGKDLACACSLDKPCHADLLLTAANRRKRPKPDSTPKERT